MDIEQVANKTQSPEEIYYPLEETPEELTKKVKKQTDNQDDLNEAFANEVQGNLFKGLFTLINSAIGEYVMINVDKCSESLSNSPYMKAYFSHRFGGMTAFLPEEARALIVASSHVMSNATITINTDNTEDNATAIEYKEVSEEEILL